MKIATKFFAPALTVLALSAAGSASSAARFTAYTIPFSGANNCSGVQGTQNSATPLSAFASCGVPGILTMASANSSYGTVGARTSASGGSNSTAVASFFDTVQFTNANHSEGLTQVAMVFELNGFLTTEAGAINFDNPTTNAMASILAQVYFAEQGPFTFEQDQSSDLFGTHTVLRDDFTVIGNNSVGSGISLLLRTITIQVPLNRNISFGFALQSGASAFGSGSVGDSEFFHTLGFAPGTSPFVLQDGVTANAGDYLVDNRFGAAPEGGVPEPGSWALMILGVGALGGIVRQKPRKFSLAQRQ